jgi:hypothetical protein
MDFYLPGKSVSGSGLATFVMSLTGPDSGTFRLEGG